MTVVLLPCAVVLEPKLKVPEGEVPVWLL